MDIRRFMNEKVHMTVWYEGKCRFCGKKNEMKIYDFGVLPYYELEKQLDETSHAVKPFPCKYCGQQVKTEFLLYIDEIRKAMVSKVKINYGHVIDSEQAEKMNSDHANRYEIFKEREAEFWEKYTDYALANWRDVVNELLDHEFKDAFQKLNIETDARTVNQYRKFVLNQIKTIEEKQVFWRAANEYFVYQHLLDLGPIGWAVDKDVKEFGMKRMRFIILYFPMGESFEEMRTEWIGQVIRKEKGDNEFLFRRISMLTDELARTRRKITDYVFKIEDLKAENSKLQEKLSQAYEDIRKEKASKNVINRDPADVAKIRELKSFVSELLTELKEKEQLLSELQPEKEHVATAQELEETPIEAEHEKDALDILSGKTIAIIGGRRQEQATQEYPCNVITHTGEQLDPEFYQTLKQADIFIVLTQFISHLAMWETKAYAIENDVPIFFMKGVNIPRLLAEVAAKSKN